MNFLTRIATTMYQDQLRARAFEAWRTAEELVAARWRAYLAADREARPGVFAAYVAALDAEAAAAAKLARMTLREAG